VFQCITHPPVNHELWLRSRITHASVEPPSGHQIAYEKDKIFSSHAKIFEVSRKNSAAAEMLRALGIGETGIKSGRQLTAGLIYVMSEFKFLRHILTLVSSY
jgi:hypothetical protein